MIHEAIENRLRQHQIPSLRGRTAAIRQLVLQASAPVVAVMLGYNHDHIARLVAEAGGTWNRYAAAITPPVTHTNPRRIRDSRLRLVTSVCPTHYSVDDHRVDERRSPVAWRRLTRSLAKRNDADQVGDRSLQLRATGLTDFCCKDGSEGVVGMPLVRRSLACTRTTVRASLHCKNSATRKGRLLPDRRGCCL